MSDLPLKGVPAPLVRKLRAFCHERGLVFDLELAAWERHWEQQPRPPKDPYRALLNWLKISARSSKAVHPDWGLSKPSKDHVLQHFKTIVREKGVLDEAQLQAMDECKTPTEVVSYATWATAKDWEAFLELPNKEAINE